MTEIPKVVKQRMARAKPNDHPDGNLLTAFAEQSLAARERDSVLTHLSQCADCREVVFLSTPQVEISELVVPVRSGWLGWPALRWGALAACAVVVVGAVSLRERSSHLSSFSAPSPPVAMTQHEPESDKETKLAAALDENRAAAEYKPRGDVVRRDEKVFRQPQSSVARTKTIPSAAAPEPTQKQAISAGLGGASVKDAPGRAEAMVDAQPAAPPAQIADGKQVTSENATVAADTLQTSQGKAKAAMGNLGFAASNKLAKNEAAAMSSSSADAVYKKLTPRWTLSADGTLQRSLDAGKTWKTIPVAADATLTAVSAMDSNIWVGGSHGALYHSTDAGDHWAQISPANDDQILTSNIIGIEFSDALHGKVTTANQQTWTTADGGQTWSVSN
jgi:hypothetical protein